MFSMELSSLLTWPLCCRVSLDRRVSLAVNTLFSRTRDRAALEEAAHLSYYAASVVCMVLMLCSRVVTAFM